MSTNSDIDFKYSGNGEPCLTAMKILQVKENITLQNDTKIFNRKIMIARPKSISKQDLHKLNNDVLCIPSFMNRT